MNLAPDTLLIGIIVVAAFTGLLFSLLAYISSRSKRILLLLGVFSLFFVKGVILAVSNLSDILTLPSYPLSLLIIDILVLGILIISGFWE